MHINNFLLLQKNVKRSFNNSKFYVYDINAHHSSRLFEKCF